MAKQGFSDNKITSSDKAPSTGYIRLKADVSNTLEYILPSGEINFISTPWELPVTNDSETDPSILVPTLYERYVIPQSAIGDWAGHDTEIAKWDGAAWEFSTPKQGWIVWVKSVNKLIGFDGVEWVSASGADLLATLGDVSFDKTYDDWFMPSKDELNEIYEQLHLYGIGGYAENGVWISYWSSSESAGSAAWKLVFGTGEWKPGYSKANEYYVIPVREFTSQISYSIRDRGPGGGFIYYKDGDYYQEALPEWSNQRWCDTGSTQHIPGLMLEIGSGSSNTNLIIADPSTTLGGAYYCAGVTKTYTDPVDKDIIVFDGTRWVNTPLGSPGRLSNLGDVFFRTIFDDWYIGSLDLMTQLMTYVGTSYGSKGFESEYYTSTEVDFDTVYSVKFQTQSIMQHPKDTPFLRARPVRDFISTNVTYAIGDEGPAGGTIFYIDGSRYYEVALQNAPDNQWSNIQSTLVGTSSDINAGLANSQAIVNQPGHTNSYAAFALDWLKTVGHEPEDGNFIKYNDTVQKWVISDEQIASANDLDELKFGVDELTVTKQAAFSLRSDGDILSNDIEKYWLTGNVTGTTAFSGFIYKNGELYAGNDGAWFWLFSGANITFTAGTYEFYCTTDLTPYNVYLEDSSSSQHSFTSQKENGLYRHTCVLNADVDIEAFGTDSHPPSPSTIWMIDRFNTPVVSQLSNKEIDYIIDSDELSIDGANIISSDAHRELVTKDYVDKKTGKADEITLEQISANVEVDHNPDYQSVINTAWDDSAPTSGWTLNNGLTYSNGKFTLPAGTSVPVVGTLDIFDCSNLQPVAKTHLSHWVCSHSNYIGSPNINFIIQFEDSVNGIKIKSFEHVLLPGGKILYKFYIPAGFVYDKLAVSSGSPTTNYDFEFQFAKMDLYPPIDSTKIKEIDYIIDDDGQSIDGSDTPMSDPHRELITRAKADDIVASSTNWLKTLYDGDGDGTADEMKLYPADPLVKRMEIVENTRGINEIYLENSNTTDNYTGVSITLSTDSAPYTNQTFISHHGPNYYDANLASRGSIMTDSSLIISAYNSTDQQGQPAFISFVVGDDYYNQKEIFRLTTNGLEMPLSDKKIWYEAGKTPQTDPGSYTDLRCNTSTGEIYAAAGSASLTQITEKFTVTAADVANGYIDVTNTPNTTEHLFVYVNGLYMDLDVSGDYTLSANRINFISAIDADDKIIVKYSY